MCTSDDRRATRGQNDPSARRQEFDGPVPDFEAVTAYGSIDLFAWDPKRWVILFSREDGRVGSSSEPEFSSAGALQCVKGEFEVETLVLSAAHLDLDRRKLLALVYAADRSSDSVRAVLLVDPSRAPRAMIYYPANTERDFGRVLGFVDSLPQTHAEREWPVGDGNPWITDTGFTPEAM